MNSVEATAPVWASVDGPATLSASNPAGSFALAAIERPSVDPGARRGPFGAIASASEAVAGFTGREVASRAAPNDAMPPANPPVTVKVMPPAPPDEAPPKPADDKVAEAKPMIRGEEMPPPMERMPPDPVVPAAPPAVVKEEKPRAEDAPLRTRDEVLQALARPNAKAGEFRLAGDADVRLPALELRGPGRWVLKAEPGPTRPKIRFRPNPADPRKSRDRPSLFQLRSGSLELDGVDVILEAAEAPIGASWAAFAVSSGTGLTLTRCTVTVEGPSPASSVVAVTSEEAIEEGFDLAEPSTTQIRATDCLLRGGGDIVDVAPGRRVDLTLIHVVAGAGGSLVHGHGAAKEQAAEPIKLFLEQVTARLAGGLVFLESSAGGPDLPVAGVIARNTILDTTSRDLPLFRVDGQDDVERLSDRIEWDGHGIIYHQIDTYRRDITAQAGTMPVKYGRNSWQVFVGPNDKDAIHGDAHFAAAWKPDRSPATLSRDDVKLAEDADASGPDLDRIPPAPPAEPPAGK